MCVSAVACLRHRFISAATEVNYAYSSLKLDGAQMEDLRFWQYVMENGKETLYKAYAISLDLYVMFCWDQLGGLASLLTALLIAEVRPRGMSGTLFGPDDGMYLECVRDCAAA